MAFGTAAEAAKVAAYQARARMGAQLWLQVVIWIILGWVALAIYIIWRQTGEFFPGLNHAYFWRWALLSTLVRTPGLGPLALRCSIPIGGRWYPIGPFVDWLDSDHLYRLPFTFRFWHYGLRTASLPIGIGVLALLWRVQHAADSEHLRGLKLLTPREYRWQVHGRVVKRLYQRLTAEQPSITLGNIVIPRQLETRHFLTLGASGAGKTMVIQQLFRQVRARGEAAIVGTRTASLPPNSSILSEAM